jgi:hypothetical protein
MLAIWSQVDTSADPADTAAAAATQGAAATPAVVGMRSVFTTKEFLQDSFAGYQESKLRNRKQREENND